MLPYNVIAQIGGWHHAHDKNTLMTALIVWKYELVEVELPAIDLYMELKKKKKLPTPQEMITSFFFYQLLLVPDSK